MAMPNSNMTARQIMLRREKQVLVDKIQLHPEAVSSFEIYLTVPLATERPAAWTEPLLATPQHGKMLIFGNFETWRLFSHEPKLPVITEGNLDTETIRQVAWNEVKQLAFGQISGTGGHAAIAEALRKVPKTYVQEILPHISNRSIAKLLGVAPCRLKKEVVE